MNPWNLTATQARVLEALAEHGADKIAARALGIDHKTVENHTANARKRMGGVDRLCAVVMYDRWKTGRDREAASLIIAAVKAAMGEAA
jgi:DNA-binding CsgD family transcriptional regulator